MRPIFASFVLASICFPSVAQEWFTVYGDPLQAEGDLIEIRPASLSRNEHLAVEVRVSRSAVRNAYGGGTYRSHHSVASMDCVNQVGWYTHMKFYDLPMWREPVTRSRTFKRGNAPVAFADIPGEADRLIRAACKLPR